MDDATLTQDGLKTGGTGKVLLLACGALAREILDVTRTKGWDHLDLHCLPAKLHNTPDQITPAVAAALEIYQPQYDRVFVVYADCGTGGQLQTLCAERGVDMVAGPHCYSFFEGNAAFEAKGEMTCFYLTDFLVRQFDAFVIKPLGLDRHPQLRDMYFAHYTTLVYQSQNPTDALLAKAQWAADQLGLDFEHRHTGYGDLVPALQGAAG
ncbi:MAG: DUF1638 domain-containing protein [Pseudomonadota bacterium]